MEKKISDVTRMVPCSVVLLSVGSKDAKDAMTATATFVAENLPLLMVSVSKNSTCNDLIEESGELALNVATTAQVELARKLGATHGKDVDKFRTFNIESEPASKIGAPLIKGSLANIECKVVTSMPASNYIVYLVEAVAYKADDSKTPIAWHNNRYFSLGQEAR